MSLSGWLHLPAAAARHRLGSVPERPWIVPAAIGWLRRRMRADWRVLELGSGRSTAWLARHAGSVLSFEDDEFWAERTRERLASAGLANAEVRSMPVDRFAAATAAEPDGHFDLVVVDFLEAAGAERADTVEAGKEKVRPGGYLLLDDSDRPGYAPAWQLLAGWRERRFSGVKDEWFIACETTIFRRAQ
jgi:predicted O-methyltransferase YrrM